MPAPCHGPIIDAHHRLWDLSGGRHPSLTAPAAAIGALGDIGCVRRDHLPADCAADTAGQGVAASVHLEALWDPARHPAEGRWLDTLPRPLGIAARYVVAAALAGPYIARALHGTAARLHGAAP